MTATALLDEVLSISTPRDVTVHLGLNVGTIKRWIERNEVPNSYQNDLSRILGREAKPVGNEREKDQLYTTDKTARECLYHFDKTAFELEVETSEYTYIEPSVVAGAFYRLLPSDKRIGMHIEPRSRNIKIGDYLSYKPRK